MRVAMVVICIMCGCAAKEPPRSCVNTIIESKGVVGESRETKCECRCPQQKDVLEVGGIVGGVLSLFER